MRNKFLLLIVVCSITQFSTLYGQRKTENLVIVTLDGMRWQEIFKGVDSELINDSSYNRNVDEGKQKFWAENKDRAEKCSPLHPGENLSPERLVLFQVAPSMAHAVG